MFDKKSINELLLNNDQKSLYRIAQSKEFNPSNLIFDTSPPILENVSLYTKPSDIHGFGVFTKKNIEPKTIIEQFLCIPLDFKSKYHHDNVLINYTYSMLLDNDEHGKKMYLLTGLGMIYNHSERPNAKFVFDQQRNKCSVITLKFIKSNEEITINYMKYK